MGTARKLRAPSGGEVLRLAIAVLFGIIVAASIAFFLREPEWSPLGPYPVQQVDSQGPLVESPERLGNVVVPQIALGSRVAVTGKKCSSEDVTIKGSYGWRSVVPNGFYYELYQNAPGRRLTGCEPLNFNNDIPVEVDKWAREAIAGGRVPEVYIGGCETPVKENGEAGAEVCWRTEPFVLRLP